DLVVPHRPLPVICKGLENQSEPLPQSRLLDDLARQLGGTAGGRTVYRYIIKRILLVVPTLVGAAALVCLLMRLIPGDICVVRLGSGGGSFDERAVTACHAQLGLDRPVFLQFVDF